VIARIFTIGGYGHSSESYFSALQDHNVDLLVDVRQRRGLRGRKYAFLNSAALQAELQRRGIEYLHIKELAPTANIRAAQKEADARSLTMKRERRSLSEQFIESYTQEILEVRKPQELTALLSGYIQPCFFCVEGPAAACHRSLVAVWLAEHLEVPIVNI